jgi:hypothetical protein
MRKMTRLSLLLLALVMSALVVPDAFGGKGGGKLGAGKHPHAGTGQAAAEYCDYYIWCYYIPATECCYGSFSDCYNDCVSLCGGPCDYYGGAT